MGTRSLIREAPCSGSLNRGVPNRGLSVGPCKVILKYALQGSVFGIIRPDRGGGAQLASIDGSLGLRASDCTEFGGIGCWFWFSVRGSRCSQTGCNLFWGWRQGGDWLSSTTHCTSCGEGIRVQPPNLVPHGARFGARLRLRLHSTEFCMPIRSCTGQGGCSGGRDLRVHMG